jgi:predicted dehydrogenase
MSSRRRFLGHVATSLGTLAVPSQVMGAGERIRVGIVGVGDRGMELLREAAGCENVAIAAVCDVYTKRLEAAQAVAAGAAGYLDHRRLLEDPTIDAVLIATPQHLHCEHFTNSLAAGKHVYQEKTMSFTVEHAKKMRRAFSADAGKHVVTIGHQACSSGHVADARQFLAENKVGRITMIDAHMFRNTPHGKPQWRRPVFPDMNPENVLWESFLGEAPRREFDANRFQNWRFFWDYSGGNVYENMCHQLAFWYKVLGLEIPRAVTMTGGLYLWKDGREVPDTMDVSMEHGESGSQGELLFTWHSGFGNNHLGSTEAVLGTDGTIERGQQIRYSPQKVNRPQGVEILGQSRTEPRAHMQNFFDAIRGKAAVNCPFELGYRVSIACRMAVESYRRGRTVRWDAIREEIV